MPRETNPCSKQVTPEHAYEVWQSFDGWFTTYVLKKYKSPSNEAKDPYARWYVCTTTPHNTRGEYGDTYAAEVKRTSTKVSHNPLLHTDILTTGEHHVPER